MPGTYKVKVEAEGFKTAIQDKVLLLAGKYFGQNFKLEVGSFHETMEVTAAPPMLETENASGGTILDEKTLQNVPVNGRQVYMMIGTVPGSQFTQTSLAGRKFGNPGWDVTNAYIIGGGVNPTGQDNTVSGGFNQFTLNGTNITQQTTYESGRWNVERLAHSGCDSGSQRDDHDLRCALRPNTGGTVNIVTKNGTNAFHGELYRGLQEAVFSTPTP